MRQVSLGLGFGFENGLGLEILGFQRLDLDLVFESSRSWFWSLVSEWPWA